MKLNLKMPDLPKVKSRPIGSSNSLPEHDDLKDQLRDKLKTLMKTKSK